MSNKPTPSAAEKRLAALRERVATCPECGSKRTEQKMYATICADCRIVLDYTGQPRLSARENDEGGFDVV